MRKHFYHIYKKGISKLRVRLSSTTVTADTRKVKASWTSELSQDFSAHRSIDAEAELTAILQDELRKLDLPEL